MASDPTKPRVSTKRGVPPPGRLPSGAPVEIEDGPTAAVDTVVLDLDLNVGIGPAPWEKRRRRYNLVKYSALPGTGKCYECGEEDYEYMLVDTNSQRPGAGPADHTTLGCWCAKCLARLSVEMMEAVGL